MLCSLWTRTNLPHPCYGWPLTHAFVSSGPVKLWSLVTSFDAAADLCFGDISIDSCAEPSAMTVHLKSSKTDPFRRGVSLVFGTGNTKICPVAAVLSYMVRRGLAPGSPFPVQ